LYDIQDHVVQPVLKVRMEILDLRVKRELQAMQDLQVLADKQAKLVNKGHRDHRDPRVNVELEVHVEQLVRKEKKDLKDQ